MSCEPYLLYCLQRMVLVTPLGNVLILTPLAYLVNGVFIYGMQDGLLPQYDISAVNSSMSQQSAIFIL